MEKNFKQSQKVLLWKKMDGQGLMATLRVRRAMLLSKHALVVPISEHQESHLLPGHCPCHSPASPGTGKHEAWHCTPPSLLFRVEKEKFSNGNAENKLALNTGILSSYIFVCRYCVVYWDG